MLSYNFSLKRHYHCSAMHPRLLKKGMSHDNLPTYKCSITTLMQHHHLPQRYS